MFAVLSLLFFYINVIVLCAPFLALQHFLHHVFRSQSSVFLHQRHRPLRSFFGSSAPRLRGLL